MTALSDRASAPVAASEAPRVARRRSADPMQPRTLVLLAFLLPALAFLVLFRLTPIVIAIGGSLFTQNLAGETSFGGLTNFAQLFGDERFWNSLKVTLIFNIIINPLQIAIAFCYALLVMAPGRGVTFFRAAFFLPMTLSTGLTAVLWNIMLDSNLGPVNAILEGIGIGRQPFFLSEHQALGTMIAIATWKGCGYWMIFLLAGLYRIPGELYEAARIDGASRWHQLVHITLPQMRRPLAFVFVADTAINFLFFAPVYIITKGGPNGATDLLMFRAYENAFTFINWGRSLALSTIILVIIGVIAAIELRLFRDKEGAEA
ncbi:MULTISPECIES: sugar ABC transporter permease [unclassified Bosea (in: a-proteobacteria)]|uniref:carbohydrate ABC transporter permease n=1 Tax=unclassified Bosea (in: a-proteobacteria) TaxID=2653178 RepID=UPI0019D23EC5|nr:MULTISPECIES: sugar ABC transporter permease [unclassified Bosea (in: a-proteobacteria)]